MVCAVRVGLVLRHADVYLKTQRSNISTSFSSGTSMPASLPWADNCSTFAGWLISGRWRSMNERQRRLAERVGI